MIDISVIIPTYNASAKLLAAIGSVLDHKGLIIQVIVIEDGSKNPSKALLERHCKEFLKESASLTHSSITYHSQSNKGAYLARIVGLEKSDGKYIKFLDQDDVLLPQTLNNEISAFDSSVDVILSDWEVLDTTIEGGEIRTLHKAPTLLNPINDFLKQGGVFTSAALYRTDLLKKVLKPVSEFRPIKADDWLIFAQICLGGARYRTIDNLAYIWNQNTEQLSKLSRDELVREHYEILNWVENKLRSTQSLTYERKKLMAHYYAKQLLEAYQQNKSLFRLLIEKINSLDPNYRQKHGGVLLRFFCRVLGFKYGIKYYSIIKSIFLQFNR